MGADLYVIDTSTAASATSVSEAASSPPAFAAAPAVNVAPVSMVNVPVPIMGESITQGVLAKWLVKVNDVVKADAVVASIETDKVFLL